MFTGITKEIGKVFSVQREKNSVKLSISSSIVVKTAEISDSISVNGVCLTLVLKKNNLLVFDAVLTTLATTNLKRIKRGNVVNLESALKVGDKLGGHFVLGHVDAELKFIRVIKKNNCLNIEIELPSRFRKSILENGSITIDGISLTVKKILAKTFTLNIIPFTYNNTSLKYKRSGDWANVEFDYLLKNKTNL